MTVQEGFPVPTEPSADDVVVDPDHFGRSGAPGERAEPGRPFVRPARLGILIGLIVALGWWRGTSVLVVVAGVILMIFLHELGHYLGLNEDQVAALGLAGELLAIRPVTEPVWL